MPSLSPSKNGLVLVKGSLAWSMAPALINFCQKLAKAICVGAGEVDGHLGATVPHERPRPGLLHKAQYPLAVTSGEVPHEHLRVGLVHCRASLAYWDHVVGGDMMPYLASWTSYRAGPSTHRRRAWRTRRCPG